MRAPGRRRHVGPAAAVLSALVVASMFAAAAPASATAAATVVALTFDNGNNSQFTLGYQQALQPHGVAGTFYVNSGSIGNSSKMTWAQLSTLAAAGDDVGGKTVDGTSLTTLTTTQQISEICNDRQNLLSHGVRPDTFAYPGGAFNTTIEGEVENCGYGNARTAGSLSPAGSTYAETLPPKTWLALRAYAPTGQVTLSNLESLVSGAAAHGGGWVPIVITKVCSQALDPNNYTACTSSAGWIDLGDLNTFLNWVQGAGTSNGAPAGAGFGTMESTAIGVDNVAPSTTISCNGGPCASTAYTSTVGVALPAVDLGSGVAATHYTTDGTTPTPASPTYTGPFPLTSSATVQYASWDAAGNTETVHSQTVLVEQGTDITPPTTTIACNGAPCSTTGYTKPQTVTLTAVDNPGGWGVAATYYTTDGSAPTTSSTVYTGPFTVKQNTTVKFFSTDLAGNAEQANTQAIKFTVVVTLTFDDGIANQYTLAFQRALAPHNATGTFYVNTNSINQGPAAGAMTWTQLAAVNNAGNEIGGHTLDEFNLATSTSTQQSTYEVCQDYQNLVGHGFYPTSFAYPFGAYTSSAESIVQSCGYTSGRAAGGVDVNGPGNGPVYAETVPPKDVLATRTVYNAPTGSPSLAPMLTLSNLESAVTGAAQNGGGWIQLVFHQICSQTYDPANYTNCTSSWGPVELDTLNALLDWLQSAGQSGGAPQGTTMETVSQVINGPDTRAPVTSLLCDGSPCQPAYNGSTTVSLRATDPGGSGVAATYYTVDGSTPTTSSPTYIQPFTVNQTTTLQWFSVDNAGNVEPPHTQTVQVQPNTDPVIGAAGDIACDPGASAFNGGQGTATDCRAPYTAQLLTGLDATLALGDNQYTCGGLSAFQRSYGPSWGVKRAITYPVPGNQDLETSGGTDCPSTPGAYYQQYFTTSGGWYGSALPSAVNVDPNVSYYSFNLGTWHVVALNTGQCELEEQQGLAPTFCQAGSPMDKWLQNDLAHDTSSCTLAFMQDPRWASNPSGDGGDSTYQQLWQDMYQGGVTALLTGNNHWYERFAPLNGIGQVDNTYGVREFIVGTGGAGLEQPGTEVATSQVLDRSTHGVIKLTLHAGSYDWQFVNDGESSFTDSGSGSCHGKPSG